jgi:photosystem I subunit 3
MKRWFLVLFAPILFFTTPMVVSADVSGLIPCKDSVIFKNRLDQSVKKLSGRLSNYNEGTPPYVDIQDQIKRTEDRFDKYGKQGLLCGSDGLPHLITDGRWNHAGEFIFPAFLFFYITGWIGWVGRSYLQFTKTKEKPNENEIIIDVPIAFSIMSSGFIWPLLAWSELVTGQLLVPGNEVTISPR